MTEREKQRTIVYACFENLNKARELVREHRDWLECTDEIIGETALHYLVIENQLEAVKMLRANGADIDKTDFFGTTPLMHAIMINKRSMAEWLLDCGATIEAKNHLDWTALSLATSNEKGWAFQRLINLPREHPIDWY